MVTKDSIRHGSFDEARAAKSFWADFTGPTAAELAAVSQLLKADHHEISQLLRPSQRPILDRLHGCTVVVFCTTVMRNGLLETQPLVLLVPESRQYLLTLHRERSDAVEKVAAYDQQKLLTLFRDNALGLLTSLIAEATDNFFSTADMLSDQIENVEKRMFDYKRSNAVMRETLAVKKSLIYMQKGLVANREVTYALQKEFGATLGQGASDQLRDVAMDTTQLTEMMTTYRDILTSAIEIHLTAISNNLNVIMKKMTSWGALILVPSLIASIFGMNFRHIPTLDSPAGFYASLIVMVVSVGGLAWYFRHKDWL